MAFKVGNDSISHLAAKRINNPLAELFIEITDSARTLWGASFTAKLFGDGNEGFPRHHAS